MATQTQVNTIVANIISAVPSHGTIPTPVITDRVNALLASLDTEVVAASSKAAQLAETNALSAKKAH